MYFSLPFDSHYGLGYTSQDTNMCVVTQRLIYNILQRQAQRACTYTSNTTATRHYKKVGGYDQTPAALAGERAGIHHTGG
jgi:hypothetical protein